MSNIYLDYFKNGVNFRKKGFKIIGTYLKKTFKKKLVI